jgi:hypothetical protein
MSEPLGVPNANALGQIADLFDTVEPILREASAEDVERWAEVADVVAAVRPLLRQVALLESLPPASPELEKVLEDHRAWHERREDNSLMAEHEAKVARRAAKLEDLTYERHSALEVLTNDVCQLWEGDRDRNAERFLGAAALASSLWERSDHDSWEGRPLPETFLRLRAAALALADLAYNVEAAASECMEIEHRIDQPFGFGLTAWRLAAIDAEQERVLSELEALRESIRREAVAW